MHKSVRQFGRFAIVGTTSFLIDYALLLVLSHVAGMDPVPSGAISFTVSLVINYLLSMRFVFTRREDLSRRRQFARFALLSAIGLAVNELIIWIGMGMVPNTVLNLTIVKVVSTMMVTLWNFFSRRRWLDAEGKAERVRRGQRVDVRKQLRIWWLKRKKKQRR